MKYTYIVTFIYYIVTKKIMNNQDYESNEWPIDTIIDVCHNGIEIGFVYRTRYCTWNGYVHIPAVSKYNNDNEWKITFKLLYNISYDNNLIVGWDHINNINYHNLDDVKKEIICVWEALHH